MNRKQIIARAARIGAARQARGVLGILSQESYHSQGTFMHILRLCHGNYIMHKALSYVSCDM